MGTQKKKKKKKNRTEQNRTEHSLGGCRGVSVGAHVVVDLVDDAIEEHGVQLTRQRVPTVTCLA